MQEIILIETDRLFGINNKLKDGWRVVSVSPLVTGASAYVVIEKDKENGR